MSVHRIEGPMVIVADKRHAAAAREAGAPFVFVLDPLGGPQQVMMGDELKPEIAIYRRYVIALPAGCEMIRDDLAVRFGDERCEWITWNEDRHPTDLLASVRKMWSDEVATIDDIPEPGPEKSYTTGFRGLDDHGLRITLPCFAPLIGPYGSGKSVFLRQLLVNLYRLHGWKFVITAFEEKVKPRYLRDFRRHFIDKPQHDWTEIDTVHADAAIRDAARFLIRRKNTALDADRLLNRIEFAVRAHGVRVVAIDPVNEIDHRVPRGESMTAYMGQFIMRLKALADDYGLLIICCAHPPKDGAEKRLSAGRILTLNDGADTAHWGNKADLGFVMWRPLTGSGPTLLNIDKTKDHDTMGAPTLAELVMDRELGRFETHRIGYDILRGNG